jgi:hypothetical protein
MDFLHTLFFSYCDIKNTKLNFSKKKTIIIAKK